MTKTHSNMAPNVQHLQISMEKDVPSATENFVAIMHAINFPVCFVSLCCLIAIIYITRAAINRERNS